MIWPTSSEAPRGSVGSLLIAPNLGRCLLVLIAMGAWSLGRPLAAVAQPGWSGIITDVSQLGQGSSAPDIAFDSEGNATAVWAQHEDAWGGPWVVQAARFTLATGAWTAPSVLSAPGVAEVKVAADAAGSALVVWRRIPEYPSPALGTVEAARYDTAQATWSAPNRLSVPFQATATPSIAMDPAGNGIALWSTSSVVQAARYTAATVSWGAAVDLTTTVSLPSNLGLVMDSAGDAVAVYTAGGVVHASQYRASTGTWGSPTPVSTAGDTASFVRLGADEQGNAMAIWIREDTGAFGVIQASRFMKATGTWTTPIPLSQGGSTSPNIAVDRSGNAFVTWLRNPSMYLDVEAIRYSAAGDAWGSVVTLVAGPNLYTGAPIAADGAGNAITLWGHGSSFPQLQFARFVAATGAWSPAGNVPGDPLGIISGVGHPAIGFDAGGNAVALWSQGAGFARREATRWVAGTPEAPTITGVEPGPGALAVHVAMPARPTFPASNLEYSIDGGDTWTPRTPASTISPMVIGGLTDFSSYTLRVRGSNAAGVGVPSTPVAASAGPVPGPPTGLTATAIVSNTVTVSWTPPPSGGTPPTGYVLEGGIYPGQVLASIPTGSTSPTFTLAAPTGAFFVRMHAVSGSLRSAPSNEIRIFVQLPAAPSAPTNLLGLVDGSSVTLSWTNTFGGGLPASLWLNVTGAITTVLPLPAGGAFSYVGVPPGTYTLSVSASNASGPGPFSNPVTLTFPAPCSGVPEVPTNFQAWKVGTTIFVSWNPPASGPALTSYTVQVDGAYVGRFTTSGRTLSGTATQGSYALRVSGSNACGMGAATPVRTVVVP